ncbi:hypothetical protein OIU84_024385 [Salix udensis]|uniref:Uncharacterized protein n=1 Tax=Salix udensis TaxID=889485 RepID=A0AAD6KH74_9ROSI|nr:hypothetical protein OIU84_024385 [Salix udensis]
MVLQNLNVCSSVVSCCLIFKPCWKNFMLVFLNLFGTSVAAETRREKQIAQIRRHQENLIVQQMIQLGKACMRPSNKGLEPDESTGADTAKEGVRKAKPVADTIGDAAMETVDGAREADKEANQKI